jgi:osmotically-inducible protein OsmY
MAGRWSDDQERNWRDRDREQGRYDDRYDVFGMDDERERWSGSENRTFDRGGGDRSSGRVFGERDSGAGYNAPRGEGRYTSRPDEDRYGRGGWQDPDYEGVSPAMRRGDYETGYRSNPRFRGQDDTRGGRYYGDDGRSRLYREEWQGDRHGAEGRRFGSYEADQRWEREMRRPSARGTYSGGTGGYDYERGYGDGGRSESRGEGFEDRAREAGDFFRRTGRRISNWFSDVAGDGDYDRPRDEGYRGARGLGPKGYKRSDERISDDIHQRLADDAWLDATHINVAVSGGEVTLSGTVDSREAKHRAERIVEDLSGVTHVQNNIRVQAGTYSSAGPGYGDRAQETRMDSSDAVKDVTDGNATPPAQKRN